MEVDVFWEDFIFYVFEGEWLVMVSFRIFSYDIECVGRKGKVFWIN